MVLIAIACLPFTSQAQPVRKDTQPVKNETGSENGKPVKPFRILTTGRQIAIKSAQAIKTILVWTAAGNRILEQRNLNTSSYNFKITVSEKIFFVMVELVNGKRYSEKIGVQ